MDQKKRRYDNSRRATPGMPLVERLRIKSRDSRKLSWTDPDGVTTPCRVFIGSLVNGYGKMGTPRYGDLRYDGRTQFAHRLAWEAHHGEIPVGMNVLHRCDNPACIRIEHLFLGTQADNMADKARKGRQPRGEARHKHTQLTEDQVWAIFNKTEPRQALAERYNIHIQTVWTIQRGKSWGWLTSQGQPSDKAKRKTKQAPIVEASYRLDLILANDSTMTLIGDSTSLENIATDLLYNTTQGLRVYVKAILLLDGKVQQQWIRGAALW